MNIIGNSGVVILACIFMAAGGSLIGCASETATDDGSTATEGEDLGVGINGTKCRASVYNCALEANGNSRVPTNDPKNDAWHVQSGVTVLDGNGDPLTTEKGSSITFNYGQVREFGGKKYAFAMATSNGSSGWFPMDAIAGESSFEQKVGHVSAHGSGLTKLGCYEIESRSDEALAAKKVVYDAADTHERAGDYLPLLRNNGKRSANLAYVVPGFSLGGTAVDHFPAGTRFRRVGVPTQTGAPHITIPLYEKASNGHYTKPSGTMTFLYGSIQAKTGTPRFGWMPEDALKPSTGCP